MTLGESLASLSSNFLPRHIKPYLLAGLEVRDYGPNISGDFTLI